MADDRDMLLEVANLRKLMIEVARRMDSLQVVHKVKVSFNITTVGQNNTYKLTTFTATKEIDVEAL